MAQANILHRFTALDALARRRATARPVASALPVVVLTAAFLYAGAVLFHGGVPTLNSFAGKVSSAAGVGIDIALLALCGAHFHWVQRPWLAAPAGRGVASARSAAQERLLAAALLLGFGFAWQPLPELVWSVTAAGGRAALWAGYATGWLVLLGSMLRAERGACPRLALVTGLALIEWCAPDLSLGHLLFAAGVTVYVALAGRRSQRAST